MKTNNIYNPGASYTVREDVTSGWGKLYVPERQKNTDKAGLRTLILGSTTAVDLVIQSLERFEKKFPEKLNLLGVATDDPMDAKARISIRKRIWAYYTEDERKKLFSLVLETSMKAGLPCYTGAVKSPFFRKLLDDWKPELILMCCFGQKIDQYIFEYPVNGMYNFHPSDLKQKIGAGAEPFHDTIKTENTISNMSLHMVNEEIDAGPVIGTSPPINICLENGNYPASILSMQEKIPSVCGWMSIELIQAVLEQKSKGFNYPVPRLDYNQSFPREVKNKLMEPASDDLSANYRLPWHTVIEDHQ